MSPESQPIRQEEVERATQVAREHAKAGAMSALAFDVLSREAEGRTFIAGRDFAKARAEEHGVEREEAATEAGNLLDVLERGPESAMERAMIAALAVRGLGARLKEDGEDEASRRVFRFVRHADWLEVASRYVVYPFVDALLDEDQAARVWSEVAQALVDDAAGRDGARPEVRAKNAARSSALAASSAQAARHALRRVVQSAALDEPTRLMASTLAGDGAEQPTLVPRLEGRLAGVPRRGGWRVVRWISGYGLLSWLVRAIAFVLGVRRRAELRIDRDGLQIKTEVSLLGRKVREGSETWKLDAVAIARRDVRYPALHLFVGALALSIGVLFGGLILFDGARSGELSLLVLAGAIVLGSAALDLALDVLIPGARGKVSVELHDRSRGALRLTRVGLEEADAFLRALRSRAS